MQEVHAVQGRNVLLDGHLDALATAFASPDNMEYRSRSVVGQMALALQASALYQYGEESVAQAFCEARLQSDNAGWVYGTLPATVDCAALIARARPH